MRHTFGCSVLNLLFFLLFRLEEQALAQCNKSDFRRVGLNINMQIDKAILNAGECFGEGGGGDD